MLNFDDIVGMAECTEEEIAAVAMNKHVPEAAASAIAEYLINSPDGVPKIRKIIVEDIEAARAAGHEEKVENLRYVLKHFIANHPQRAQKA